MTKFGCEDECLRMIRVGAFNVKVSSWDWMNVLYLRCRAIHINTFGQCHTLLLFMLLLGFPRMLLLRVYNVLLCQWILLSFDHRVFFANLSCNFDSNNSHLCHLETLNMCLIAILGGHALTRINCWVLVWWPSFGSVMWSGPEYVLVHEYKTLIDLVNKCLNTLWLWELDHNMTNVLFFNRE